jgi:hypothetical protein
VVTFDATAQSTPASISPHQWTHTATAGAAVVVGYCLDQATTSTTVSATYGGQAMTLLGKTNVNGDNNGFLYLFGLASAPGGAQTVSITFSGTTDISDAGSISYNSADPVSPFGPYRSSAGATANPSLAIPTTSSSSQVACFCASGQSTITVSSGLTQRVDVTGGSSGDCGSICGGNAAGTGGTVTAVFTAAAGSFGTGAVEVLPPSTPPPPRPPQPGSRAWQRRHHRRQPVPAVTYFPPPDFTEHGTGTDSLSIPFAIALSESGSGSDVFGFGPPVITGLAGGAHGYFVDQYGNPRLVWGDAAWALSGNVGRWSSGAWQSDYDTYFATRAGQGFTVIYTKPMGTTQSGNLDDQGKTFDSLYPFQGGSPSTGVSGANPSSGLTSAFWARIDYMLASAAASGITIFLNAIGYNSDFDSGPGPLAGKSSAEFGAYGTALGTRYAGTPNLVWVLADDYFGSSDAKISAFITALRAAGDSHALAIENYPESTSRKDIQTGSALTVGAASAQFNFVYSYEVGYFGVEAAYTADGTVPVIQGDGYFYQGGTTYAGGSSFAFDRDFRQEAWWALSSGARGKVHGDEGIWQWPSTAQSDAANHWWHKFESANIVSAFTSLPGWHLLLPDTGSALVTAGRGTRATFTTSQYEPANTDAYVTASITPTGSLAVIYMSHGTTITIDESQVGGAGNYTAKRMDPDSGTLTTVTAGTTYNSTAWGNNGKGDPDWVLVLFGAGASTVTLTDSGAGSDALAVAVPVPFTESGTGTDALSVSVTVPLTEAGAGADQLTVSSAVPLADSGAGSAALGVMPGLSEAGAGSDQLVVSSVASVALSEAGSATDTLVVSPVTQVPLTESGAGSDSLTVTPVVPFTDAGAGSDALGVLPGMAEAGAGADSLAVQALASLPDAGTGTEVLGVMPGLVLRSLSRVRAPTR